MRPETHGVRRSGKPAEVNEAERWVQFGQYLVECRRGLGLTRREAAKRSKLPEASWRDLESGHKSYGGVRVLPHPSAEVLQAVAEALELAPDELLRHVPRRPAPAESAASQSPSGDTAALARRIARLSERDRRIVEQLVESMLSDE